MNARALRERFRAAADGGALEIFIYGRIGTSWWDDNAMGASALAAILRDHPNAKTINLRINSLGGSVFEGSAMYNQLVRAAKNGAHIIVDIDGVAASAASWLVMAGHERRMGLNGYFMIHEASGDAWGPAGELEKTAQLLRKMNEQMLDIYAQHSSLSRDDLRAAVASETWYTASEALSAGFLTSTAAETPPLLDDNAVARAELGDNIEAYGFKRAPADLGRFFSFGVRKPADARATGVAAAILNAAQAETSGALSAGGPIAGPAPAPRASEPHPAAPAPEPPRAAPNDSLPPPQGGPDMKLSAQLLALLGLTADSSEAEIEAAIKRKCEAPVSASEAVMATIGATSEQNALARVRELQQFSSQLLALTSSSSGSQAISVITGWQASAGQSARLAAQVSELEKQVTDAKRDGLIKELSADGKLPPSLQEWARTQTAEQLTMWAAGVKPGAFTNNVTELSEVDADAELTREELETADQLGMTAEQFKKAKKDKAKRDAERAARAA